MVLQPHQDKSRWFGLFRFRSPLLTESILFLFLRLLRCFTSPRVTSTILFIEMVMTPYKRCPVSRFGNPRIKACLPLPEVFRSLLRPSSSVDAKAFTDGCNWFMQTLISRRLTYSLTKIRPDTVKEQNMYLPQPGILTSSKWWAQTDLNHRPRAYQARALTN